MPLVYRVMLCLWGVGLLFFSLSTIKQRSDIELTGTIIESTKVMFDPPGRAQNPVRYGNIYTVRTPENKTIAYQSGNSDPSLRRDLAIGTRIDKRPGSLVYQINDQPIDDFPLFFYATTGTTGLAFLALGLFTLLRAKHRKDEQ